VSGTVVRVDPARTARLAAAERRIAFMTRMFDELIEVPGTGRRFGIDPIIGLVPVVGDIAGGIASFWIIAEAARFRIPTIVLARMIWNAGLDMLLGAIPFVGDIFDFFSKANERNLALFRRHASDPDASTADTRLFFLGLGAIFIGLVWLTIELIRRLLSIEISILGV
jgi:Domain of unknown function (DUF4112)